MKLRIFQIDSFTNHLFGGNPACVVPLDYWLDDSILFNIAKENAVSETAFFINKGPIIQLRWFTPEVEIDLCGHATLASAHCLKTILGYPDDEIIFETLSGNLKVTFKNECYTLDLPSWVSYTAVLPEALLQSFSIVPIEVLKARDYILLYDKEEDIKNISINRSLFDKTNLGTGGVIITAPGAQCDFVSRFFTPQASILEDPVTGSAHCSLIPFWSQKLGKKELLAFQLSERKGVLHCIDDGERVLISGYAKTYLEGSIYIA